MESGGARLSQEELGVREEPGARRNQEKQGGTGRTRRSQKEPEVLFSSVCVFKWRSFNSTKKVTLLENVYKKRTAVVLSKWARENNFVVRVFFVNSAAYVPTSRTRMYAVFVDVTKVSLLRHPTKWGEMAQACAANIVKPTVNDFMFSDSDTRVLARLERLQAAFRKRFPTNHDFEYSLQSGDCWPKCFEAHQASRRFIEEKSGVEVMISYPEELRVARRRVRPGGAMTSQGEPGGARRSQGESGEDRSQDEPG